MNARRTGVLAVLIGLLLAAGFGTAAGSTGSCRTRASGALPSRSCTPGAVMPSLVKARICAASFRTSRYRHVTSATRRKVYARYGLHGAHPFPEWEVDHLVPLELGGSNRLRNLWPEHHPGDKDQVENKAHDAVCSGQISLARAQRLMSSDWRKLRSELDTG